MAEEVKKFCRGQLPMSDFVFLKQDNLTHSNTCGTTEPLPMPHKWYNYNAPKQPVMQSYPKPPAVKKPSKAKVGRLPPTLRPPTLIIQPQSFIPQNATSIFQNNQQQPVLLRVPSVSNG